MKHRFFLLTAILLWANTSLNFAQAPSIRFVDGSGKTLSEVEATLQNGVTYVPIDVVNGLPNLRPQYIRLTKRLTLDFKGKKISLRIGNPSVRLEADGQTISLEAPPQIINRQPMLPMAFFTEVLPQVYDLDVSYNPALQRVRIKEQTELIGNFPSTLPTEQREAFLLIIDAGHGGADTGCRGNTGIKEKDVVLNLSKQIQTLCQQNQIRVLLTRDSDFERRPAYRTQVANQNGGNLFLSLHCNASFSPKMEGIHIYINTASGKLQSDTQANLADGNEQIKVLSQETFLEQSRQFAQLLRQRLELHVNARIPLTELPIVTLSGVYMPAVLIEVGYLSNEADEARLADADNLASMAAVIVQAIEKYTTAGEASDGR